MFHVNGRDDTIVPVTNVCAMLP